MDCRWEFRWRERRCVVNEPDVWQQSNNSEGIVDGDFCTGVRTDSNWGDGRRRDGLLINGDGRDPVGEEWLNDGFLFRNECGKRV